MAVGKPESATKTKRSTKKGDAFHPNCRGTKDQGEGQLGVMAAMMLMTVLYTCRVARPEITRAITFLAKRITKWDFRCDQRLHRLMCYVNCAADDQMMGWIGDDPSELSAHLFCDADFAGCPYTLKSTNGCHADIQGPNSRFPWSSRSNGQTSTAQSTQEAELNSLRLKKPGRAMSRSIGNDSWTIS